MHIRIIQLEVVHTHINIYIYIYFHTMNVHTYIHNFSKTGPMLRGTPHDCFFKEQLENMRLDKQRAGRGYQQSRGKVNNKINVCLMNFPNNKDNILKFKRGYMEFK